MGALRRRPRTRAGGAWGAPAASVALAGAAPADPSGAHFEYSHAAITVVNAYRASFPSVFALLEGGAAAAVALEHL